MFAAWHALSHTLLLTKSVDVSWTSGYTTLENAWHEQNDFFNELNEEAPDGVNNVFASSFDFWWYDTNKAMLDTAFGAVAIALSAAFLVVLISSRSIRVTLFAVLTIAFILTAVAALLVVSGWQLGLYVEKTTPEMILRLTSFLSLAASSVCALPF